MKGEGNQLVSTWVKWWIILTMLGVVEFAFNIVRRLQFPWGWGEYLLVVFLAGLIAFLEWGASLGFRWISWIWKNREKWS